MAWGRRPTFIVRSAFLVVFLLFLVYATFFAQWRPHGLDEVKQDLNAFGVWGPLAAIAFQAVATVMLVPGFILIVATAIIFGLHSIWISLIGQTLGAMFAFLIARHVGRDPLHRLLGSRMIALERLLEDRGFRYLLLIRTMSLLPTPIVVYAPGLVNLKMREVALAAIVSQLPFVIVFGFLGDSLARVRRPSDLLTLEIMLPLLLLFALFTFPILLYGGIRRARRRRIP